MNKILIVVDDQNGFVRYEQTKSVAEKIKSLVDKKLFDCVIATRFINTPNSQYVKFIGWNRLTSSPDIDLIDGLTADYVVDKNVYTCVTDEFLSLLTKINGGELPKHVFIAGIDTDCCVLKTSVDLFEHFVMPIVLTNYCNSNGGDISHNAGIEVMSRNLGKKCLVSGEISSACELDKIIDERKF